MTRTTSTILVCVLTGFLTNQLCSAQQAAAPADQVNADAPLSARERLLLDRIAHLEERVDVLEQKLAAGKPTAPPSPNESTLRAANGSAFAGRGSGSKEL